MQYTDPMMRRPKRLAWRKLKFGIGAGLVLATLLIVWLTGLASLRITLAESETRAEANLAVQTAVLERLLDKFRLLSPLLARGPDIARLIVDQKLDAEPGVAAIAAGMSGAEEIWLMDASGKVIVSSQESVPANAIGGAATIPHAFTQASQGQLGRELIPGTPETPSNYVFASPLRRGDTFLGVLAVRVSLDDVEQAWALSKDPILALDGRNRVVVSNVPELRGKTRDELDPSWNVADLSLAGRMRLLIPAAGARNSHMQLTSSLPVLEWEVRTLVDIEDARREKRIRSSLEAAPKVFISDPDLMSAYESEAAEDIFITSQAELVSDAAPETAFRLPEESSVAVLPGQAAGIKCARSWKYFDPATADPEFPDVTARDAAAIREIRG